MAHIQKSVATLRIFGDTLLPEVITGLLGSEPTVATIKGQIIRHPSGREQVHRQGSWRLEAPPCEPENLDQQVSWLLSKLTSDLEVWAGLNKQFKVDLFCGLFMGGSNEGFSLSSSTMLALGSRGIEIGFDVYDASE